MRKFNLVKLSILKILLIGGIGVQTFSCTTEIESPENILAQMPSSTSLSSSSGLALLSSSSGGVSSSSVAVSSSSSAIPSSSSVAISSSSVVQSSSSVAASSSSSVAVSSSSVALSSSSSKTVSSSSSAIQGGISYGTLSYEGQDYKTVKIGDQVWMAENLNYDVPDNATDVCYDNNSNNCTTYGRLYDWATAMGLNSSCNGSYCASQVQSKHQGICPSGWHIPSDDDWSQLINYVGGNSVAGKHLKAKTGWSNCGLSGSGSSYSCEDTHGFSALPGGLGYSDGSFYNVGNNGYWWSSSEGNSNNAYYRIMYYDYEYAYWSNFSKTYLFSVRCLQD